MDVLHAELAQVIGDGRRSEEHANQRQQLV
jgi:hypothetical protein